MVSFRADTNDFSMLVLESKIKEYKRMEWKHAIKT